MPDTHVYRAVRTIGGLHIVQRRRADWFAWYLHESGFPTIDAAENRADELNMTAQESP